MAATRPLALLALVLLALAALPPVGAGSAAHPEIEDVADDVNVNNRCSGGADPCPSQSVVWPGADLDYAYVSDTPDAVLLTLGLKSGTGFKTASPTEDALAMEYGYLFSFSVGAEIYGATAHFPNGGPITPGGAATVASIDSAGKELTLTVPKAPLNLGAGQVLDKLFCQVQGLGAGDFTLADRAPNAGYGTPYTIANGTGPATIVRATLSGPHPSVTQAFSRPTNATYIYRWTSPSSDLMVGYRAHVTNGAAELTVATSLNRTLHSGMFDHDGAGNLTVADAAGALVITLRYTGFNGTLELSFGATTQGTPPGTTTSGGSTSAPVSTSTSAGGATTGQESSTGGTSTSATTTKKSPGLGALALLGAAGLGVALRRRLPA
jgi:hypothetical protein